MLKPLKFVLFILLFAAPAVAQQDTTRFFFAYGDENLTVSTTALAFTAAEVQDANNSINRASMVSFKISCSSTSPCPVVLRYEGTDATTSIGFPFAEGDSGKLYGYDNINNSTWIRTGANDADVYVVYHR